MTLKPVLTFGRFKVTSSIDHNEPRNQLYVPKEETVPNPLKNIDVTRSTQNGFVVVQKKIVLYCNVESSKHWSDSSKRVTKFSPLIESREGYMWSWWTLTQIQTTSRPDHVCPEIWTEIGTPLRIEKQEWKHKKPKLDNGRGPRGIYT